jgi:hypothetical protein
VAKSRGGLVFVDEPTEEVAAAQVLGCCQMLAMDTTSIQLGTRA